MRKLAVVLAVLIILVLSMLPRACDAAGPDAPGSGAPPISSHKGKAVVNNDPDEDGRGPDRTVDHDSQDWNNGCQPWHEEDDNEGICRPVVQPTTVVTNTVIVTETVVAHNCTVYLYGNVIEVFEGNVDVRNPDNEDQVLAEANGFLEFHGRDGATYQILWWNSFWGHADSPVTEFVCSGTITLYEPPLRPWFSPPQLKWR